MKFILTEMRNAATEYLSPFISLWKWIKSLSTRPFVWFAILTLIIMLAICAIALIDVYLFSFTVTTLTGM